jgi:hypothetical protein
MRNSIKTPYLQNLHNNQDQFQKTIDDLLGKYNVQPVGNGYIDLIVDCDRSLQLVDEFAKMTVAVERLTWWCHTTPESTLKYGCPHGLGGPLNRFGEGHFSECTHYPEFVLAEHHSPIDEYSLEPHLFAEKCSQLVTNYIKNALPNESFYSPCLQPGFWLNVPFDWKRKYYWT